MVGEKVEGRGCKRDLERDVGCVGWWGGVVFLSLPEAQVVGL